MSEPPIYHVCRLEKWEAAQIAGAYGGSDDDARDGFIHFSARAQLEASVAKHRAGQEGLVVLSVDPARLGNALKWEPARDGALFPHLHGALPVTAVISAKPLPLGDDGNHVFPELP